jgi:hypothetical protein
MSDVLNLILTHQPPAQVARMLAWWEQWVRSENILLAYGGPESALAEIAHSQKIFIADPRLRTGDHQRELQSYTEIYQKAGAWLRAHGQQFVYFAEFDQLPVRADFLECYRQRLAAEQADVLAYKLWRVDGTSHPHYLFHSCQPGMAEFWESVSCRAEKQVVLSMLGTGSFWTREAFLAVAECTEPFPIYHEIYIPTLAHHLGFRLRDLAEQNQWVKSHPALDGALEQAQRAGAWTLHPVKRRWLGES